MKSLVLKLCVNVCSLFILLLCLSSITSAQGTQRPSQRSFATVLSKIKEKKSGRDRMQQQSQQPEYKSGGTDHLQPPQPVSPGGAQRTAPAEPVLPTRSGNPDPASLPSRQPIRVPTKPATHG